MALTRIKKSSFLPVKPMIFTEWLAGASPRQIDRLSQKSMDILGSGEIE